VNPATALATVLADELIRCGLREAVLAPGSRSAPLALALHDRAEAGDLRLHVRIDERSASFLALGLAKASSRPVVLVCTSGTAAAHFHAAVIEADEAGVPLLVLTADRPPELRGTGANQAIDQLKLYGPAVRWFCEVGVPEARPGMVGYWRSLACRAWALAAGLGGGSTVPGPVHLNLPLREPLVADGGTDGFAGISEVGGPAEAGGIGDWPDSLGGRADGAPWTRVAGAAAGDGVRPARWVSASSAPDPVDAAITGLPVLELPWTERGVIVCGDGNYDPAPLLALAETAGWPILAEPSSNARCGPNALSAYSFLLDAPGFAAANRPDLIISAGRPGLSRGQLAFLRGSPGPPPARHVVLAQGPGRWADPARTATDVAAAVRLVRGPARPQRAESGWLASWLRADAAARAAGNALLNSAESLSEPQLARDLAAAAPGGALLWAASSLPVRDLDQQMAPRADIRVLASRGASGIDGLVSSAAGAALAHQAAGGGPAFALLGDLAVLHDAPGLFTGPAENLPDLCLVVVNNDGGGIFSTLEQAAIPASFERVFGTPHGAGLQQLARAAGLGYRQLESAAELAAAVRGEGLRIVEVRTDRAAGAALRAQIRAACASAVSAAAPAPQGQRRR
jgi:2-succinyl-5-enolpyruvyl-6-hydroxy-3-cyclohexene-1-carboxylate synthase